MDVPDALLWWRGVDGGAAWLNALPRLVDECAARWSLTLGAPFARSSIGLVVGVTHADGASAVLKVNFPEHESEHEADALALWGGTAAVRLLAHDPARRALLLERIDPATQLWDIDEDTATTIAVDVLRRLWRAPPAGAPFRALADDCARWAVMLPRAWEDAGQPFERALLDDFIDACRVLPAAQRELVVCHQDLHGGNVLLGRSGWVAIDPKPIVAERELDVASWIRDRRPTITRAIVTRRLDRLSDELALDRERARRWALLHALAWAAGPAGFDERHVAVARWLRDA